jgi:hypothetical protein
MVIVRPSSGKNLALCNKKFVFSTRLPKEKKSVTHFSYNNSIPWLVKTLTL